MDNLTPKEAFAYLNDHPEALFVDCRSELEFHFVGHPVDALHVPWQESPDWTINPNFVDEVKRLTQGDDNRPVILICRSGQRSVDAGLKLEQAGMKRVINVLDGFEGSLDSEQHRGTTGGWRFEGLPWEQI